MLTEADRRTAGRTAGQEEEKRRESDLLFNAQLHRTRDAMMMCIASPFSAIAALSLRLATCANFV